MIYTRIAAVLTLGTSLSSLSATTLFWGGGESDLSDGTTLAPLTGNWLPGVLQNWASDVGPAFDYTAWTNGDSAVFPSGAAPYDVKVAGAVSSSALTVGAGAGGDVAIRGTDATTRSFTLSAGSVVSVPGGSILRLRSDPSNALSIVTSGFVKAGAGAFEVSSTTVSNSNTAGVIDVQEGTLRILGDRAGIFSNESVTLSSAASVLEVGQGAASVNSISGTQFAGWSGVVGSRIRSSGPGTHFVSWLNSTTDGVAQDVLLTDGLDGSRLGFVKAGNKTLTLTTPNNYTGGTAVVAGRLVAGTAAAIPGVVSVSGSGTFEPAADGAPASISVDAGGTLVGKVSVNAAKVVLNPGAALAIPAASDLPPAPAVLPSWAGRLIFEYPIESTALHSVPADFPGIIALAAPSAASLDFSATGETPLSLARLGAQGSTIFSGLLTPHNFSYRLGGGGTLTLDQTLALTGNASLDVGYGPLLLRANATAASTVSITGANDLSGEVTVGRSHTLRLEGASGALASASAFKLRGGTLSLLDTATGGNGNRLPDAAPLVFERGGTLTFLGTRGLPEDAGEVRVEAGEATITAAGTGIGASGNALLRLASLSSSRGPTSTVTFQNGTNNNLRFQTQPPLVNGILGGWSITGSANFSDINPSNGQPRQITPLVLASESDFNAVTAAGNYTFDSAVTVTAPSNRAVNSLRAHFATGGPFLVDLGPPSTPEAPNTLTIESGGLLLSSNIAGSVAGGALTAGAGGNHTLYAFTPATAANSAKTLASPVLDNGASAVKVVKAGPGQLILTAESSYSGGTFINSGKLQIASAADVPVLGTGPVTFDGSGTTLSLGNTVSPRTFANAINVNADSTFSVPSGQGTNVTFSGAVTLAADTLWSIAGNVTKLSGPINGAGALRFNQGSTHSLTGSEANTFTGPLFLTSGTLTLSKSGGVPAVSGDLHIGENDSGFATEVVALGSSEQINNQSLVYLYGAGGGNEGVLRLNGDKTETIGGLRSGPGQGVVENGGASGTSASLIIAAESDSSFGGLIRNHSSGDVTRALTLTKTGSATQRLFGSNEHTGPTLVSAGTLQLDGTLRTSELTVRKRASCPAPVALAGPSPFVDPIARVSARQASRPLRERSLTVPRRIWRLPWVQTAPPPEVMAP